MGTWLFTLTLIAALGCALVAGALFAFSSFVMPALARLPAAQGMAAMQSINVTAVRPAFMTVFLGTAALCVVLTVSAVLTWGDRSAVLMLVGSALYLLGMIVLTRAFHVPMNDALAGVEPSSAGASAQWTTYCSRWTAGNHVRVLAGLAAAVAFTLALAA